MMFPVASLWTLLALSISIMGLSVEVRNSSIILPMTSRLHFSNGTNLVQRQYIGATLDNANVFSSVLIGVGGNPTFYHLMVNTGSAITWIGAAAAYNPTNTAFNTQRPMAITYPTSFFAGILYTDTVEITDGETIDNMAIGAATQGTRGVPCDGMLGIGPRILSRGCIPTQPERTLATITERLYTDGSIAWPLVGLFFKPSTQIDLNTVDYDDGRLVFGDENPDFDIGNIAYTPHTSEMPASRYWGINQSIVYGNTEILRLTAGVVDSGSTFIGISSDAYDRYKTETGDPGTGMLSITLEQYDALRPLEFHIGSQIYRLSPNAQIWPRWLNYKIGGTTGGLYLVIKRFNTPTGWGLDFILGYVFLQHFYSMFDILGSRIGFARTPYTDATTN